MQAGTKSWKAFLFGSSDASNFITVDKTPASLWPAVAAARVFGVNSWSLLVPQAVEGVLAVGFLYLTIRRWFGAPAGLLAGLVFATTPAATLIFRFNNPDALLVLCLVVGAYGVTRAIEDGRTRWLVLAGAGVGFAFLAKELQAFLVLPGFAAGYFLAGPGTWWRRFLGLVEMGLATARLGGLVRRDPRPHPRVVAPVHRRFAEQQLLERAVRLQRLRPTDRERDRQRRRWCAGHRRAVGTDRTHPDVQLVVR